jgi:hypothetical protein
MNKNLKVKFSKEIKIIEDKNIRPNLDLKYTCRPHKSILKNRTRTPHETCRYYNWTNDIWSSYMRMCNFLMKHLFF